METDDVFAMLNNKIKNIQVSGDGVSDYEDLSGKPQINGVTLQGDLTSEDLGIEEFSGQYQDLQGKPETLPNPHSITFGGIIPEVTYDGSKAANVIFPSTEIINESVGTPVGEIISYMGNTAPINYLVCDGSEYNISEYQELANHFIKEFGSVNYFGGDGENTFAVPDLRGEFLRGTGTAVRNTGSGSEVGLHQDATQNLSLGYDPYYKTFYHGTESNSNSSYDVEYNCDKLVYSNNTTGRSVQTTETYEGTGIRTYTTRPTNTSVLYCIKYKPTYFVKVDQSAALANNLTTTDEGFALDARQGKELNDEISNCLKNITNANYYDANNLPNNSIVFYNLDIGHSNFPTDATWGACLNIVAGDQGFQIASDFSGTFHIRSKWSRNSWTSWKQIY